VGIVEALEQVRIVVEATDKAEDKPDFEDILSEEAQHTLQEYIGETDRLEDNQVVDSQVVDSQVVEVERNRLEEIQPRDLVRDGDDDRRDGRRAMRSDCR